jgi:hypothetical protein
LGRPIAGSQLKEKSNQFSFRVAKLEDDFLLRQILSNTAMDGNVRLAFAREPSAFATGFGLTQNHGFIIATHNASGEIAGICEKSAQLRYVNGVKALVPYIGALRITENYRHRVGVLKGGFEAMRRLLTPNGELNYAITSIASDNIVAKRILCAGLKGFPIYTATGEIGTFTLPAHDMRKNQKCEVATPSDLPQIAECLQRNNKSLQFAPVWRLIDLQHLHDSGTLPAENYVFIRQNERVVACMAVWDQTKFKQVIVASYAPWLRRIRPFSNLVSMFTKAPHLPPTGSHLKHAYLSHVAVDNNDEEHFMQLNRAASGHAKQLGFSWVVTGFDMKHPFYKVLRKLRNFEYRSEIYMAYWPEDGAPMVTKGMLHPEVSLL